MSDKIDVIYDMLKDMAAKQDHDRERASEWREKISEWSARSDQKLDNLEEGAKAYLESVSQNREAISSLDNHLDERLKPLETPALARQQLKKWIIGAGTLAAAIMAVLKLLDML